MTTIIIDVFYWWINCHKNVPAKDQHYRTDPVNNHQNESVKTLRQLSQYSYKKLGYQEEEEEEGLVETLPTEFVGIVSDRTVVTLDKMHCESQDLFPVLCQCFILAHLVCHSRVYHYIWWCACFIYSYSVTVHKQVDTGHVEHCHKSEVTCPTSCPLVKRHLVYPMSLDICHIPRSIPYHFHVLSHRTTSCHLGLLIHPSWCGSTRFTVTKFKLANLLLCCRRYMGWKKQCVMPSC